MVESSISKVPLYISALPVTWRELIVATPEFCSTKNPGSDTVTASFLTVSAAISKDTVCPPVMDIFPEWIF